MLLQINPYALQSVFDGKRLDVSYSLESLWSVAEYRLGCLQMHEQARFRLATLILPLSIFRCSVPRRAYLYDSSRSAQLFCFPK